jgi:hypothetical protein
VSLLQWFLLEVTFVTIAFEGGFASKPLVLDPPVAVLAPPVSLASDPASLLDPSFLWPLVGGMMDTRRKKRSRNRKKKVVRNFRI